MDESLTLESEYSIEYFRLFSLQAIKQFLSVRKKPITGSFETLVARAFAACEENAPIDVDIEHRERILLTEYKQKYESLSISDPLSLKTGWVGEKSGIKTWPKVFFMDISNYYKAVISKEDLWQRVECEYKEGKAYRYFTNGFIGEVFINQVDKESKHCIVKTKCLPSQRVNNKQYDVWSIIEKSTVDQIGGKILSSYCTCTAGLLGSCNHVAGLLFRMEAAVLQGITDETCTMKSCEWNVPKGKKQIKPGKLSNFLIKRDRYDKAFSQHQSKQQGQHSKKIEYNPVPSPLKANIINQKLMRTKLFNTVRHTVPNSAFVEIYEGKVKVQPGNDFKPSNLVDVAERVNTNYLGENRNEMIMSEFIDKISSTTSKDIEAICNATKKQSDCEEWYTQRKGRLTASKFKRVFTKTRALRENEDSDYSKLVSDIMNYSDISQTRAMKYGIAMEKHAKKAYKSRNIKLHKNLSTENTGLVISKTHPWIAVSPDLIVNCDCHGRGVVEIKCPESIKNEIPNAKNYKHLVKDDNETVLRKSSEYFFQIQGQMAIAEVCYADFFVFTAAGCHTERITFDKNFWDETLKSLDYFWKNMVAPELLFKNLLRIRELEDGDPQNVPIPSVPPSFQRLQQQAQVGLIIQANEIEIYRN